MRPRTAGVALAAPCPAAQAAPAARRRLAVFHPAGVMAAADRDGLGCRGRPARAWTRSPARSASSSTRRLPSIPLSQAAVVSRGPRLRPRPTTTRSTPAAKNRVRVLHRQQRRADQRATAWRARGRARRASPGWTGTSTPRCTRRPGLAGRAGRELLRGRGRAAVHRHRAPGDRSATGYPPGQLYYLESDTFAKNSHGAWQLVGILVTPYPHGQARECKP